jgi:hypothetical protein
VFSETNSANEVQKMTITVSAELLRGKKNQKLVSKLLAKGFSLKVQR